MLNLEYDLNLKYHLLKFMFYFLLNQLIKFFQFYFNYFFV